jgi:hypothetical protein
VALVDFGYLPMEEIKLQAVHDRLKKFDGNHEKAAASLEIHVNSIYNILKREDMKAQTPAQVVRAKEIETNTKLRGEGWASDPQTGASKPAPLTQVPGIDQIVARNNAAYNKRNSKDVNDGPTGREQAGKVPSGAAGTANSKTTKTSAIGAGTASSPASKKRN